MASILELFIRRAVALTLESDPGLLISAPHIVDGVKLLKRGDSGDIDRHVKQCTEGTWSAREQGLARVFGGRINAIYDNLAELQAIQTLRNSIAHDFARTAKLKDYWYLDPAQVGPLAITRISVNRLKNLMRAVSLAAREIEARAISHIGSFELFKFWQLFVVERVKPTNKVLEQYLKLYRRGGRAKLLSSYSANMTGATIGREYCHELIQHYDSC